MMSKIKQSKKLIVIGLIFFISATVIYFNNNKLLENSKDKIVHKLSETLNLEVKVEDIQIKGLNSLFISGLNISNKEDNNLIGINQIIINYSLKDLIFNCCDPIKSISNIKLIEPTVSLAKEDWNYQDLLDGFNKKASDDKSKDILNLSVYIKEGVVTYKSSNLNERLEYINGVFHLGHKISFDLKTKMASIDQGDIEVEGLIEDNEYRVEMAGDNFKLKELQNRFAYDKLKGIKLTGDLLASIKLQGKLGEAPEYYGKVEVDDTSFSRNNLQLEEISGDFDFNKYGLKLNKLDVQYNEIPFEIEGNIFSWSDPQLNLKYDLDEIPLADMFQLLPIKNVNAKGLAQARGAIRGELSNPGVTGELIVDEAKINGSSLNNFTSNIYYKDKVLNLEKMVFDYASGEVNGDGTIIFLPDLSYVFSTSFKDIDIAQFKYDFNTNVESEGIADGDLLISGDGIGAEELNLLGSMMIKEGKVNEYNFASIESSFWLNKGKLFLNRTKMVTSNSDYNLEGLITLDGRIDLILESQNIRLEELKEFHGVENLEGEIDLTGQLKGKINSPEFDGGFEVRDLVYNRFKVDLGSGELIFRDQKLELKGIELPNLSSKLKGNIDFVSKDTNLILDTSNGDGKKIMDSLGIDIELSGTVTGETVIESIQPTVKLRGGVVINEGKFFKQKFDQIDFNFRYEDMNFIIDKSYFYYQDSLVIADGFLVNDKLDLNFKSDELNLENVDYKIPKIDLTGQAKVEGRVYGSVNNPQVIGDVKGRKVEINDDYLGEISGQVSYEDANIYVKDTVIKAINNEYQINGAIDFYNKRIDLLTVDIEEGSTDHIMSFLPFDYKLSYQYTGKVKVTGLIKKPEVSLDLHLFDNNEVGYLDLSGAYKEDDFNLTLLAKEFGIEPINNLGLISYQVGGDLNFTGEISGNLDSLNIDSNLKITEGKIAGLEYQQLVGRIRVIDGERVIIDQRLQVRDGNVLNAKGQIPLKKSQKFDLSLNLEEGSLSLLPLWLANIKKAKGRGSANIRLLGALQKPEITGQVEVISGSFSYPGLDRRVTSLNGRVEFVGDEIKLNDVNGKYGDGNFDLKGKINLVGLVPDSYDLEFSGDDIAFEHGSWQGLNKLNLRIEDSVIKPVITGKIKVYDTRVKLPFKWPTSDNSEEVLVKPVLDLKIESGRNVRVCNDNIDILVQNGELDLITDEATHKLNLIGDLESRHGQFDYYNTEFKLDKATAVFREYSYIPNLQIKAYTKVKNLQEENIQDERVYNQADEYIDIYLGLSGLATKLNFNLSSDPSLTEKEIINLLTNKGGVGSLLNKDYQEAVKNEMWRMVGEEIENELIAKVEESFERSLDLDQVQIKSILSSKVEIKIGKFVSDNLMLKYDRIFGIEEEQSFGFEYHFNKGLDNWLVDGHYNNYGEYQVGLEATIPF